MEQVELTNRNKRVCPVERAGGLDSRIRRWLHNPQKILGPYVKEGMTVIDIGCGPGLYAIEMALMVGDSGRVIAADLQDGMLDLVRNKVAGTEIENRVTLHKCESTKIGVTEKIDFALAFYMVHELPDQEAFYSELATILKPGGQLLVIEPPFHVSRSAFRKSLDRANAAGLKASDGPRVLLSKTAVLCRD
jgi:ubiquinone/menaquinone biosynthesis C-methylase UbiE